MKDNKQNLTDLIGALAVDIEEIKKKLDAKDSPDKNEALKRLEAKLEPVIRFFNGNAPENVNAIFGSKEAIEEYKQSIGDEAVASLRLYTEANEKDMRKHGVLTIKEQLNKILERLTSHIENDKLASEKSRQKCHIGTMADNPPGQGNKRNKAVMEQSSRWLAQESLRMGWHWLYACILYLVCHQLGTMA